MSYDTIIIGGGHNGLVCAAYLAKGGQRVLVLERRHLVGGAAVSEQIYPGFTYSVASYVVSLLRPAIVRDLELARFGYDLIPLDATFSPDRDGPGLLRTSDNGETHREISRHSRRDADTYPLFGRTMARMGKIISGSLDHPLPAGLPLSPAFLRDARALTSGILHASAEDRALLARMLTMSATDFLSRWFESDRLKAALSVSGIIGTFQGVSSPGTAYVLLHHYMGEIDGSYRAWGFCRGGTGAVSEAIASAAKSFGAAIRTEASVSKILVENGAATGVVLQDGEEIRAKSVVSGLDPQRTFRGLLSPSVLPSDFLEQLSRYRMRGSSAKVNLALDSLPEFACRPGFGPHLSGDITICPNVRYLEDAFDEAVLGKFSRRPFLDVMIPSLIDPSLAPRGKHVMSIFVQYAPYHLSSGAETWPEHRDALGNAVLETLEEFMPGLSSRVLHRQVLTPWDLESTFGLTEGNIFHGELSLEQLLFLRPVSGFARHRTPVRHLWMCGSGTHPGGGIMGASGRNAALLILSAGGRS